MVKIFLPPFTIKKLVNSMWKTEDILIKKLESSDTFLYSLSNMNIAQNTDSVRLYYDFTTSSLHAGYVTAYFGGSRTHNTWYTKAFKLKYVLGKPSGTSNRQALYSGLIDDSTTISSGYAPHDFVGVYVQGHSDTTGTMRFVTRINNVTVINTISSITFTPDKDIIITIERLSENGKITITIEDELGNSDSLTIDTNDLPTFNSSIKFFTSLFLSSYSSNILTLDIHNPLMLYFKH